MGNCENYPKVDFSYLNLYNIKTGIYTTKYLKGLDYCHSIADDILAGAGCVSVILIYCYCCIGILPSLQRQTPFRTWTLANSIYGGFWLHFHLKNHHMRGWLC